MSEGDFEVMPIGTISEVAALRKYSNELIALVDHNSSREELVKKVNELREFYNWHVNQYPVSI